MKLQSLKLTNFQAGNEHFEFNGEDMNVFADNGVGKTRLASSFSWLLFGKDSLNKSDFPILPIDTDGDRITDITEAEVEGVLVFDELTVTLRKVFKEKWTKNRKTKKLVYSGNEVEYFVDDVPVKKGQYEDQVYELISEDKFKLLTNPRYFNEVLHWQSRREMLEQLQRVTPEEVIATDPKFAALEGIDLDGRRKLLKAKVTEVDKELDGIPLRIDEANKNLPEVNGSPTAIQSELTELREQRTKKQQELVTLESGGSVAQERKELAEVESQIIEEQSKVSQGANAKMADLKIQFDDIKATIERNQESIVSKETVIKSENEKLDRFREEWKEIKPSQFTHNEDCNCPTCHQQLPQEQIDEAITVARESFNKRKADKLAYIDESARAVKKSVEELMAGVENARINIGELQEIRDKLAMEHDALRNTPEDRNVKLESLETQKRNIEREIEGLKGDNSESIRTIEGDVETIALNIYGLESQVAQIHQRETGLERVRDLTAKQKELGAELDSLVEQVDLLDKFAHTKALMLEDRVNGMFRHVKYRMFETQVNGDLSETCDALYQGIQAGKGLNNGACQNAGLDVINVFSESLNIEAPIFIDNAESVTDILPTRGQQIRLYVSEVDKVLRYESANKVEVMV